MMDRIDDIEIVPCTKSGFVHPYRVLYKQDGKEKLWDCIKQHNSVAVLLFNVTRNSFVLVKQFRPAVYMMNNAHIWKDHPVLDGTLSWKKSDGPPEAKKKSTSDSYGPAEEGLTYELCADIIDKSLKLEQVVQEEILEETGYDVPLDKIEYVTMYNSSVGVSGTKQWLYFAEVTDDMQTGKGGGSEEDHEMIEVVYIPLEESEKFVFDTTKPKTTGLCFSFFWFNQYKKPYLNRINK